MDFIGRMGADLVTPPQASPVMPTSTSPLQMAMNRPEVQFSQPSASTMVTTDPRGTFMAMASPTPQIRQEMTGAGVTGPRLNPPQVVPARTEGLEPNRLTGPRGPVGSGVSMTGPQLEQARMAARVVEEVQKTPEIQNDPTFMDGVRSYFGDRENMVRLALAFNSMRTRPDTGLASVLGDELKDIRATRTSSELNNRTAQYFDTVDPQIANAIRSGLSAKDAIAMFREKEKGVVVGKMIVNPTTGEIIYNGATEGSDLPDAMRTLLARAEQAGLQPGSPEYQQFMINGGQRAGMAISVGPDGTFTFTEGGATPIKLTDSQSNALAFGGRMQASNQILSKTEMEGTQLGQSLLEQVPVAGNYLLSPEYQQYSQAKRNFINAVLRKESGAAIAESEFTNADKQYFPQPGDSPEVIQQKRENRELATQLMMAGVPIQGLTENPKVVLERIANDIPRPNTVPQDIWDIMKPQEKLTFK